MLADLVHQQPVPRDARVDHPAALQARVEHVHRAPAGAHRARVTHRAYRLEHPQAGVIEMHGELLPLPDDPPLRLDVFTVAPARRPRPPCGVWR
ncbi:hypothetical protein GCM10023334_047970 [Nonomuraea thailandensis]